MTQNEMEKRLMILTGEEDDDILLTYLDVAAQKILNKCYPFRTNETEVPEKYQLLQIEIAVYLLNKRGAEGETVHNENGINRTYESSSVPDSMLAGIVPFASTFFAAGS